MSVDAWETAEELVLRVFQKYFPNAQKTVGSGNKNADGDIRGVPGMHIDVKDGQRSQALGVTKRDLYHTISQALNHDKHWIIASRTKDGKLIASCDLELLACLLEIAPKGYFG